MEIWIYKREEDRDLLGWANTKPHYLLFFKSKRSASHGLNEYGWLSTQSTAQQRATPLGPTCTGFKHKMFLTRNRKQMFLLGAWAEGSLGRETVPALGSVQWCSSPSFLTCGHNRGTDARHGPGYGEWTQGTSQALKYPPSPWYKSSAILSREWEP